MTWVYFDGGQRDGQLQQYGPELTDHDHLLLDGTTLVSIRSRPPSAQG